jgi:predicted site-specific integrase-resolvase
MNEFDEDEDDLKQDYSKVIYAMCRKISGPRVSKRNIRNILDSLTLPDITHLLP